LLPFQFKKEGLTVRIHHLLLLLFFSSLAIAGDQAATASLLRDKALESNRGWEIVESLTTEVGPRLAGTDADRRAVSWAKALLEQSKDAGIFDKVWLEPVSFPIWQRHREQARVVSPYPQPLTITALGYSGSTVGEVSGEVIAFDNLSSLQEADEKLVAGKIVFINQPMLRDREGAGYAEVVPNRYAAGVVAKDKGAVAALIRSVGTDSHRFPHAGVSSRVENPLPVAALSAPDADQLQRILDREETLIVALDIEVSEEPNGQSYNVIAQIDGRVDAEKIVLVGAHLDSWDLGTGAIDDGAGVAITVAAAQLIGALPQRPKHSVRVVLFANEEQGIWGAKAYAKQHKDELKNHLFASESDFGAGPVWRFDTENEALMSKAMPHLATLNIEKGSEASSGGPDIKPLLEAGVPVFRLKQDGTDYFDYHHTADDTLDKIDAEELKQNIAAWAVVTFFAADMD
jgi:carboxypeptidase Q